MTLLDEIQAEASDDETPLSNVLRKCQILAARLRYQPLKDWVEMESNGYPAGAELPSYRIMHGVVSKANFAGPFGQVSNYLIPKTVMPDEELQTLMATMPMRDSVAAYESMMKDLKGAVGGGIKNPWPDGIIESMHINGMRGIEAWQELPASAIAGMLSQIRNRVLTFTLEIEEANPELGERPGPPTPKDQEKVATIYQTVIHGGSPTLMQGGAVQQHITVAPGDLVGLVVKLKDLGVPVEGITELTQAIDADKSSGEIFGQRTEGWLAGASRKAASGAWKLAAAAAPDVLAAMLKGYLGLH